MVLWGVELQKKKQQKTHNLKLGIMFYLSDFPRTLRRALRDCSKEAREESGYIRVYNKDQVVRTAKNYC